MPVDICYRLYRQSITHSGSYVIRQILPFGFGSSQVHHAVIADWMVRV
jgi:hypothetical protein